jgi:hypothetical protein
MLVFVLASSTFMFVNQRRTAARQQLIDSNEQD